MKKMIVLVIALAMLLGACGSRAGIVRNVVILPSAPEHFSAVEFNAVIDSALARFRDFADTELLRLWYDAERSEAHAEAYMTTGRGSVNGVAREDVIVLFADFRTTRRFFAVGGLQPNATVTNGVLVLIRESTAAPWIVDDWGPF